MTASLVTKDIETFITYRQVTVSPKLLVKNGKRYYNDSMYNT